MCRPCQQARAEGHDPGGMPGSGGRQAGGGHGVGVSRRHERRTRRFRVARLAGSRCYLRATESTPTARAHARRHGRRTTGVQATGGSRVS
ncbi:MAG: hypothetical protein ACK55I_07735, partial [bacterium]